MKRKNTVTVKVGNLLLGGNSPILIQSMSTYLPKDIESSVKQILRLEDAGCDIVRVAVKDEKDALAIRAIKNEIHIPIVADIHFDYSLGILAIDSGADAIRFNPGNIGKDENVKKLIDTCITKNIPVRIGVNSGSIDPKFINEDGTLVDKAVDSLKYYVSLCESYGMKNIVLSIKMSSVDETIEAYQRASKLFNYPLHIGLTEAGIGEEAVVKSSIALGTLLREGIGDTIRVSITGDPVKEVEVAREILLASNAYLGADLISCPTCGRTEVNLEAYALEIKNYLNNVHKKMRVAVMGCLVNGPGEARDADMGVAFITGKGVLFLKGKTVFQGTPDEAIQKLKEEIDKF